MNVIKLQLRRGYFLKSNSLFYSKIVEAISLGASTLTHDVDTSQQGIPSILQLHPT